MNTKPHHCKGKRQDPAHLAKRIAASAISRLLTKLRATRIAQRTGKTCIQCGTRKPLSEFGKSKLGKDGHRTNCKECHRAQHAEWRKGNNAYDKKRTREWAAANKDRSRRVKKIYNAKNKDQLHAKNKVWRLANKEGLQIRAKEWRQTNKGKVVAISALRRARKRNAQPAWLTDAHKAQILIFYEEAARLTKEVGVPHHVDHIYPICGKNENGFQVSCGLHVPWNLQILTAAENISKKDRNPEMEVA